MTGTEQYSRQSERDSMMQTSQTRKPFKQKLFVDTSVGKDKSGKDKQKHEIFYDIEEALKFAKEPSVIKISSDIYREPLMIGKQHEGLVLKPKEKGGQVSILT